MRELSKNGIEKVIGSIAEISLVATQNHPLKIANGFRRSTLVHEIAMPRFHLVGDYFSKKNTVSHLIFRKTMVF
jgi:hypothetical protein